MREKSMEQWATVSKHHASRRSFLKNGIVAAGAATMGTGLLANGLSALGADREEGGLTEGDAAILRFLAAAEILETDLWQQYNELGGEQNSEVPGQTGGSALYKTALNKLDADMS